MNNNLEQIYEEDNFTHKEGTEQVVIYLQKKSIKLLRQKVLIAITVSQTSFSTSSLANIPLVILTLK